MGYYEYFSNRHVIVTGAGSGIGKAIALAFLRYNARVVAFDKSEGHLENLHVEWERMHKWRKGTLRTYRVDLRAVDSLRELFDNREFLLHAHVLINNAGIDKPYTAEHKSDVVWNEVLGVNLDGARHITECVLPIMQKTGFGSVVFITSIHTLQAFYGGGAYDTSKCALEGYMRWVALEYAMHNIRANAVAPGFIYPTGITGHMDSQEVQKFSDHIPAGRAGLPEDIANAVLYLASPLSLYITGQVLRVDGGLSIKSALPNG
jgi:NAD(P)-dependent dehydrogenase (short-subunit alcohol dehydrogenase family)